MKDLLEQSTPLFERGISEIQFEIQRIFRGNLRDAVDAYELAHWSQPTLIAMVRDKLVRRQLIKPAQGRVAEAGGIIAFRILNLSKLPSPLLDEAVNAAADMANEADKLIGDDALADFVADKRSEGLTLADRVVPYVRNVGQSWLAQEGRSSLDNKLFLDGAGLTFHQVSQAISTVLAPELAQLSPSDFS